MRRPLLAAVFLLVVLAVVVGLHAYLVRRLVWDAGLEGALGGAAVALLVGLGALLVVHPLAERRLSRARARWVAWPAALWMGFAFLLVTLLGAGDLALWLVGGAAGAADRGAAVAGDAGASRALAVAALAGGLGVLALREGLRAPRLRRIEVPLARWPRALDRYRVVQLSDLHIGSLLGRRFAADLVARVNALAPDLVVVTGDLVDGSVERLREEVAPVGALRARHGVFFVSGNHDHYSGVRAWEARVEELGLRVLRNARVALGTDAAGFDLAGVDDHHGSWVSEGRGEDLERALAGRDPARPLILLAHDPSTFRAAARAGVDLQLSGHTHGGQIFPFSLLVRLAVPFLAGLHSRGGARLYVSRGTGFWGPPMRLLAPAELTELVLRSAPRDVSP